MIERLVGMQAQVPSNPYVALWARLRDFRPAQLAELIETRAAVRSGALMRGTIHLVSARDALALHPLTMPLIARMFRSPFLEGLNGADLDAVIAAGRELLATGPMTRRQLSEALATRFPAAEPAPLAYAVTHHVALVQVPPRGLWKASMQATWCETARWVGAPLDQDADPGEYVLRYLRAFGPATPADVRAWWGITGLRAVIDRLRPGLRTYRDEHGRELLDVEDGKIADPALPAPPRFLPEYDNLWLSHDDRSRVTHVNRVGFDTPRGTWIGSLFVDGFFRCFWRIEDGELQLHDFETRPGDPPGTAEAVAAEGERLREFVALPA